MQLHMPKSKTCNLELAVGFDPETFRMYKADSLKNT